MKESLIGAVYHGKIHDLRNTNTDLALLKPGNAAKPARQLGHAVQI